MPYSEMKIRFKNNEEAVELLGAGDENIRWWEEVFDVRFRLKGDELMISGEKTDVQKVGEALKRALKDVQTVPYENRRAYLLRAFQSPPEGKVLSVTASGKPIKPLSEGQRIYVEQILTSDITLCIGPAGTGKTFLAVACGVNFLKEGRVERIILTRPAVEAGESLGFLPGDMIQKINPYLRPLYDALFVVLGLEKTRRLIEREVIEIAPLAFMRGRTLRNAFIILDEAQNVRKIQMKMFLTRLGEDSRAVVTGDITQIDLPTSEDSGLIQVIEILKGIQGISIVRLTHKDVIRHPIVTRIIQAYEESSKSVRPSQ